MNQSIFVVFLSYAYIKLLSFNHKTLFLIMTLEVILRAIPVVDRLNLRSNPSILVKTVTY